MDKHCRIDSELLIMAIQRNECLWNKDRGDYHKKELKEIAWTQICEELVDDWDSLSNHDKTMKQVILKKRWNNIRDYYKKDLAWQVSGPDGQPAKKRKLYVFAKKLEFLKPFFIGRRNSTLRVSEDGQEDSKYEDDEEQEEIKREAIEIYYTSGSEDNEPIKKKKKTKTEISLSKHWTYEPPNVEQNEREEEETDAVELQEDDCDLLFLKSLAPDMKILNRRQKLDFKLGILQLYKKIVTQSGHSDFDPLFNVGK